jgi:NAD(P)-dependent dehydrogenase (short-subunit alcohol dehydrogenase family)
MGKLDGKIAIITGGASGIGEAAVRLFIEEGANVVIADILDDRGNSLSNEFKGTANFFHANVSQESDVRGLVNFTMEKFGKLDCMFNNAGIGGAMGAIEDIPTDAFDITMGIIFRSVFLGMKLAVPIMKKQGSGTIISTASIAGLRTGFAGHIYSAAKAAIVHLTRSVAMELGEKNVRVNCICPGAVPTEIFGRSLFLPEETTLALVEILKDRFKSVQALKRSCTTEEIAKAGVWLASDESSFVTGHALVVDGGNSGGRLWQEMQQGLNDLCTGLALGDRDEVLRETNRKISQLYKTQ